MLIVLEGLDGAGKSTQITLLQNYFREKNRGVHYLHFPRFDTPVYGDLIARFLRGELGSREEVNPFLVALLFAGDRREASGIIKEWLSGGEFVILDRYVYSNIAFQCAKVKDPVKAQQLRNWILDTEYRVFGIPEPDINLFLDVPVEFVESKLSQHRTGDDREYLRGMKDIHEESINYQAKVREIYLQECRADSKFYRIECAREDGVMLSPGIIHNEITTKFRGIF
jgi:dTMP kinase